jgi:glycosyltransferase involved in cell wall biosynthesis
MTESKLPHLEILLPVFNEVKNILPLLKALDGAIAEIAGQATVSYLFVNDGSNDGSSELLQRVYKDRQDIRFVDLIHNFGHGAAITCLIEHFEGDIAVIMDADLQDAPSALPQMFLKWKQGAKTVVAERGDRGEKNKILFKAFYFLLHKTAKSLPPINFGTHCLLDKSIVARIRQFGERNRYFPGLVSLSSGEIHKIQLNRGARQNGSSRVGFFGLVNLALTAFVSFSSTPIRLVSILGFICSASALLAGILFIAIKIFTVKAIPGWASIMTAVAMGSGIQLLCLGIMGEYVARIYEEVKQRPLYWVDKIYDRKTSLPQRTAKAAV